MRRSSSIKISETRRLPTGTKLILILSAAMLPLALIAVFAIFQTLRVADAETRARLRVASSESARAIAIELAGDMGALRVAMNTLGTDPADVLGCARAQGIFAQQSAQGTRFVIRDEQGRVLCGAPLNRAMALQASGKAIRSSIVSGQGILLGVAGNRGMSARAFFSLDFLRKLAEPSSKATSYSSTLIEGERSLALQDLPGVGPLTRLETMKIDLTIDRLALMTSMPRAPITSSLVVAMVLPLLMWIAAVGIAWFVVDRLLIQPLRTLRANVAAYRPGEIIGGEQPREYPAQELVDLADTFQTISHTVAEHEAGLAEGLVRQTKLTREVHHRVKNNLQVISSLINFHARGSRSADATTAYSGIQRRVDALAVVHRNHFAEMEENRGLSIRSVISELAANIRATAPEGSRAVGMTLDIDGFLVTQDVAIAVAFLVTEAIELATTHDPTAQVRVAIKPGDNANEATLRIISHALVDSDMLQNLVSTRYGRVMEGLSRQLRSKLHHDPIIGAYQICFAILGRD